MTSAVSIVIVNYNTCNYLREALQSIVQHCQPLPEIIVVDNASVDDSCSMVREYFPQVLLIESPTNAGFGGGNNLGVAQASQPYVMLFNSDAVLKTDTAEMLYQYLESHPEVSCVCPKVVLPVTGEVQPKTFGFTPTAKRVVMQSLGLNRLFPKSVFFRGTDGDHRWQETDGVKDLQVGWVSGVCMMMRKQDYLTAGGFDPRFFMYCEDIDLCMKLAKLGKIMLVNDADIMHYGGASSKTLTAKVKNSVWQQRHLLIIVQDFFGGMQAGIARLVMILGMLLRLAAASLTIPKKGVAQNESLRCAWARLKDLLGFDGLPEASR